MKDRLRDQIWQFMGFWAALVALFVTIFFQVDSKHNLNLLDTLLGWFILCILILPPVLIAIVLIVPVPAISDRVKGRIESFVSSVQGFFRSTWGRRILAFVLLLGLAALEYIRLQFPFPLWPVKLFAFFLQFLFLLVLVFQIGWTSSSGPLVLFPFVVDATQEEGIDTGLFLRSDQRIRITASREVSIDKGITWMRPNGVMTRGANAGKLFRHANTHLDEEDGTGVVGALIGWIGDDRDTSSFFVGEECVRTVDKSGRLYLGVNDTRGSYRDNTDQSGNPTFFTVCVEMLD